MAGAVHLSSLGRNIKFPPQYFGLTDPQILNRLLRLLIIHATVDSAAGRVYSMQKPPSATVAETQQSDLSVTFAVSSAGRMTQRGGWCAVTVSAASSHSHKVTLGSDVKTKQRRSENNLQGVTQKTGKL